MTYSCFDIAKKFLKLAKDEGLTVSPMKLLKLTYIAHGYHLAITDKPLFYNDIQAWRYGPVIPDLYHIVKRYGSKSVDKNIVSIYSEKKLNNKTKKFVSVIWNAYKGFNGLQLSSKTHLPGTPWDQVYNGHHFKAIDNSIIKEYYKTVLNGEQEQY